MKKWIVIALLWGTTLFANEYVVKTSEYSLERTVERFIAIIQKKGFILFANIDHARNAKSVGLEMSPMKVVIFGNPMGGTKLMQQDIKIGLELPLKVAFYEEKGVVKLIYQHPKNFVENFAIQGHPIVETLTVGLDKLTEAAIH